MSKAIKTYLQAKDADPSARVTTPTVKLTQAIIDSLPTKPYDYQIREATVPSMRVRVRAVSGTKVFEISRKVEGRTATAPICRNGQLPYSTGPESVLKRARAMMAEMDKGITPSVAKAEKRVQKATEARLSTTVLDACLGYVKGRNIAASTLKNYEGFRDKLAEWHHRPLQSITEDDVADMHERIGEEYGPIAANNVLRHFRSVWRSLRRKLNLGDCPTIIFTEEGDKLRDWNTESRRTGYVARQELKDWWDATERLRQDYVGDGDLAADYLQFAMLTGLRRREIVRIQWEDINYRRKTLAIPENKSKRPYHLPLTDALREIIDRRRDAKQPFYITEPRRFIARVSEWCEVPFTIHDLRRSFLTHATAAGIPMTVCKALVNHSRKQDVTDGYIQINDEVLRDAADTVQAYILGNAGRISNVVPIGGAKHG